MCNPKFTYLVRGLWSCIAWGLHCIFLHWMPMLCMDLHCMNLECICLLCIGLHCRVWSCTAWAYMVGLFSGRLQYLQIITILHRALQKQWQKVNQILESQQTPHTWHSRASYGVSQRIWEKTGHVVTPPHCNRPTLYEPTWYGPALFEPACPPSPPKRYAMHCGPHPSPPTHPMLSCHPADSGILCHLHPLTKTQGTWGIKKPQ